jgi:hypothetical protein
MEGVLFMFRSSRAISKHETALSNRAEAKRTARNPTVPEEVEFSSTKSKDV